MTDERWEELMRQVDGLLQRQDIDCACRMIREMLAEQVRQRGPDDPTVAATRLVLAVFIDRMGRRDEARELMALAEATLLKLGESMLLASCLQWRAELAMDAGAYADAEPLYRRCLQLMDAADDADDSDRAQAMQCRLQLVRVLRFLRRPEAARELLRQLAEDDRAHTPQELRLVARAALMLGDQLVTARHPEAMMMLSRARQLHQEHSLLDAAEQANLQFCLARLAGVERQFSEAERHYLEAVRLCGPASAAGGLLPGGALLGLGQIRAVQCRWAEAMEFFQQVLNHASGGGAAASLLEFSWSNLGRVCLELHRYEEAEGHLERALKVAEQSHAPDSDIQVLRQQLSRAQQGKAMPADRRGAQSVDDILHQLCREHGEAAGRDARCGSRLLEQATEWRKQSRWDRALLCYQAAQRIFEKAFGPEHEAIADCRYWQGLTLTAQNLAEPAEQALRGSPAILERIGRHGRIPRHQVLNALGVLLMSQQRAAEARDLLQQARAMAEQQKESESQRAGMMMNLGIACNLCGQSQEAEGWHLQALGRLDRDAQAGRRDPALAQELANLANVYIGRGEHRMAEAVLQRAVQTLRQQVGENHPLLLKLRGQYECIADRLARSKQ